MMALLDSVETLCDEDHPSSCSLTALHWCYLMRASIACSSASPVDKEQHMERSTLVAIHGNYWLHVIAALHAGATLLSYTSLPRQVLLCCSTLWRVEKCWNAAYTSITNLNLSLNLTAVLCIKTLRVHAACKATCAHGYVAIKP